MGAAGALNENQTHFLNIVKNNTERLNILVNDLLDVSRIESGRVTFRLRRWICARWPRMSLAMCCAVHRRKTSPWLLSLDAPKKLPRVYGDAERVRQIMGNLDGQCLSLHSRKRDHHCQIQCLNGGHEVQVDVKDNGVEYRSKTRIASLNVLSW
jgi:K+-sensing histidine kinase KdpD